MCVYVYVCLYACMHVCMCVAGVLLWRLSLIPTYSDIIYKIGPIISLTVSPFGFVSGGVGLGMSVVQPSSPRLFVIMRVQDEMKYEVTHANGSVLFGCELFAYKDKDNSAQHTVMIVIDADTAQPIHNFTFVPHTSTARENNYVIALNYTLDNDTIVTHTSHTHAHMYVMGEIILSTMSEVSFGRVEGFRPFGLSGVVKFDVDSM